MRKISLAVPNVRTVPEQLLAEARVNMGMITAIDSMDIENGAVTLAKNARCRKDKTGRRPGKTNEAPAKPNSNKILGLHNFKLNTGITNFLRFTRNSIHRRGGASWTNIAVGTGGSLTGSDNDYFSTTVVLNKFFFANGVDKIQQVNIGSLQYEEAGVNSPKVKYITGFFNRVVGAYRVEGTEANGPVTVVWCADADTTKWPNDAPADITSGQSPIIDSPSDLADFITGIFGGPSYLLLPREKSIWACSKQPIGSAPFYFATALQGIGADSPLSIRQTPGGLAWLDTRTAQVYMWNVGSVPEEIGDKVYDDIVRSVDDPSQIISGYDAHQAEYSIGVVVPSTTIMKVWTFNRRTKSWVFDEIDLLSYIADIDSDFGLVISFDELVGTFDDLTGTFDALGVTSVGRGTRYYALSDGDFFVEDASVDTDNGESYETDIQSKDFHQAGIDTFFSRIRVELSCKATSQITLSYSKDKGNTWKVSKVVNMVTGENRAIEHVRTVNAKHLRWRITADNGMFDILEYNIFVSPAGPTVESK